MESKKHNFSPVEKKNFLEILTKYKHIVEDKNTDGSTLRCKNSAWDQITLEYNASPVTNTQANNKQLRRLWMNLKQRQRDALTKERQYRIATGGGPAISDATLDPDVAGLAPGLLVEVPGAIDSDSVSDFVTPAVIVENTTPPIPVITTSSPPSPLPQPHAPAAATQATFQQTQSRSLQGHKISILQKDYDAREQRLNELHTYELQRLKELHQHELQLIKHKTREAKAKADLAEYLLCKAMQGNSQ